jgi:hypothetical protein
MAAATMLYAESVAATTAATTTYVDLCSIPSTSFVAGKTYLILASITTMHGSAANEARVRLVHGAGTGADWGAGANIDFGMAFEGLNGTQEHEIQYMTVFTQPGTAETIKLQMASSSTTTVTNIASQIFALKLSDDFVQNTDWFYNEFVTDYTGTATATSKASISITPPNTTDKWLIIGDATWDVVSITTPIGFELHDSAGVVLSSMQVEGEDATNEFIHHSLVWTGSFPTTAARTLSVRPFNSGSSIFLDSAVFALNLSKFQQNISFFDAAEVAPAASPTFTNIATGSVTPTVTGNWFYIAGFNNDVGATATDDLSVRLQDNNSGSFVTDPNTVSAPGIDNWDVTDEIPFQRFKMKSLTSGALRTINMDATMIAGTTVRCEDRYLVGFSAELAGVTPRYSPPPNRRDGRHRRNPLIRM